MNRILIFTILILGYNGHSQINPFKEIGQEVEVLTLSNGKYQEDYYNDTLRRMGDIIFNTITYPNHTNKPRMDCCYGFCCCCCF